MHSIAAGLLMLVFIGCEPTSSAGAAAEQAPGPAAVVVTAPSAVPSSSAPKVASAEALAPPPWAGRRVSGSGFPCAIEDVLASSCRRCHWDPRENDAPFSMVKWEDTQKMRSGKPIHVLMRQMVGADLMPPLDLSVEPKVSPLSAAHKQTLLAWLDAGAKKSSETCTP